MPLFDLIRFSGEKSLICGDLSFHHLSIRRDLLSRRKDHQVTQHQLRDIHDLFLSVTDHGILRRIQKGQIIQNLLGTELLNDTDDHVGDDDRHEHQVLISTCNDDEDRKTEKDGIEISADITNDNTCNRL